MPDHDHHGSLASSISTGMVQIMAETTGRGPTSARTTIARDHVVVMLRDTLTNGERSLAEGGFRKDVLQMRHRYQEVMGPRATALVEQILGRRVIAFMSDNHLDPDLAVEIFVLEHADDDPDPAKAVDAVPAT
jgi:uncharacterized protein YbcI